MKDKFYASVMIDQIQIFERTSDAEVCIHQMPAVKAKGSVRHKFKCFKIANQWYGFNAANGLVEIYDLPDMKRIAYDKASVWAVWDVYIPRFRGEEYQGICFNMGADAEKGESDNDDSSDDWESHPIAFVIVYDPYGGGNPYLCIYDLSKITKGELTMLKAVEVPDWLEMQDIVRFGSDGYFYITKCDSFYFSSKTGLCED